jgi:hypothetical protein
MFLCKFAAFASVTAALAFTAGCAAETGPSSSSAEEGLATEVGLANPADEGSFKLYASVHPERDPLCDVYTSLELTHVAMRGNLIADLHEAVEGGCRIAIPAEARQYRLVLANVDCGSHVYTGTTVVDGQQRDVTITDHRTRYCRDFVPAQVLVEEHPANGDARTLYSFDPLVSAQ